MAKVAEILKKSEKLNLTDWNAMNIATVSAKNVPSSRMVLLKKINDENEGKEKPESSDFN